MSRAGGLRHALAAASPHAVRIARRAGGAPIDAPVHGMDGPGAAR
jgi:hypothetical protein